MWRWPCARRAFEIFSPRGEAPWCAVFARVRVCARVACCVCCCVLCCVGVFVVVGVAWAGWAGLVEKVGLVFVSFCKTKVPFLKFFPKLSSQF